jgi:type I restriction enzyme S subunit
MNLENKIPNSWIETTLGEIVTVKGGKRLPKGDVLVIDKTSHPYIRITDFNGNSINKLQLQYVPDHVFEKISRYITNTNDVLISIVGTIGLIAQVDKHLDNASLTENCVKLVKLKNIIHGYLFYYLTSRIGQYEINKNTVGAVQKKLPIYGVQSIKIKLPPLPEQKAIANVLTSFDDKIELLQQQNTTLESIAQTIFKEWFGKYQIGDELPEGWRIYKLSELVGTINGYSYKGKELVENSSDALVTLKSFDRNGGFQTRGFKPFKGSPKPMHEVKIGDLVVAHTDLTQDADVLGNPAFIFDNGGFEKMYITMDLVKVESKNKDIGSSFLYYLMKDRYFKGHCVGYSNGTTVLHLSKKAIPEYELCLPTDLRLIKRFTEIANDTTNKISLNKEAIKSLIKTRDTLLPKLMSGQVRVKM